MNFYQTTHGPSRADFIAHEEAKQKNRTPEQAEKVAESRERRDMLHADAHVVVDISDEEAEMLKPFLYDHRGIVEHDPKAKKLYWSGFAEETANQVRDLLPEFAKRLDYIRREVKIHVERRAQKTADIVKEEKDSQSLIKKEAEFLQEEQAGRRADQILSREAKAKLKLVFIEEDQKTWKALPESDLDRSDENVTRNKTAVLGKIKACEKKISDLQVDLKPFADKVSELEKRLDTASNEEEYKDFKIKSDYNQLQIDKLQKKLDRQEETKGQLETELKTTQYKIDVLNLVTDARVLQKDFHNWGNRRSRVIQRNEKLMRDLQGLENLRENLNQQWRFLTQDNQDLCPQLLRTERQLFVI